MVLRRFALAATSVVRGRAEVRGPCSELERSVRAKVEKTVLEILKNEDPRAGPQVAGMHADEIYRSSGLDSSWCLVRAAATCFWIIFFLRHCTIESKRKKLNSTTAMPIAIHRIH